MTLSPVARGAKAAIDSEWLDNPPYDLSSQAVAVLIREGRLVGAAGAAELARLESLMNAQAAELTEAQVEALVDAGNRAVNDYYHERACSCDAWPSSCCTDPSYAKGFWDTDAFAVGAPAVVGLWEVLRGAGDAGEVGRLRTEIASLRAERHSVYRAGDVLLGLTLGTYTSRESARDHCEHRASTLPKLGEVTIGAWRWRLPRPDAVGEELYAVADGGTEHATGYTVTALAVASKFDKEADA